MSSSTAVPAALAPHCQFVSPGGRHSRMLAAPGHDSLCSFHLNKSKEKAALTDPDAVAAQLFPRSEAFATPESVNRFLGKLMKQLARKRIDRRDALALAYIAQLLLSTFPAIKRNNEDADDDGDVAGLQFLRDALRQQVDFRAADAAHQAHEAATRGAS
jgi:hypothetical protein